MMNYNELKHLSDKELEEIKGSLLLKFIGMIFKNCLMTTMVTIIAMLMLLKENSILLSVCLIVNIIVCVGVFLTYVGEKVVEIDEEIEVIKQLKNTTLNDIIEEFKKIKD